MAENSDGQDKIFDATPKRIEDAKKEGQVLTSKEVFVLSSMFSMILMGLLFYINSILGFIIIYRLSILIGKYSEVVKNFFIWLGKNSLNIFLFHPFFLSIVPYILIANLNQKEVYNKPEYLILIYVVIFCTVYGFHKAKIFLSKRFMNLR